MSTMQKILVATDLSAPAHHAVERACYLAAEAKNRELCLLHVTELGLLDSLREVLGDDLVPLRNNLRADAMKRLQALSSDTSINQGIEAQVSVIDGNPLATIAAEANSQEASLLLFGARGESFLRHALLGSTAARLLRKSVSRPALVVKQAPRSNYRSVLVAVDFSPASEMAIRLAKYWAPTAGLMLINAYELPYEGKLIFAGVEEHQIRQYIAREGEIRRRRLHELAASVGLEPMSYGARVIHGDPSQQIIAMEQEVDADLIVVGKHGSHIAEELLLGSVTKHVLAESQCDVLVICDPREAAALSS